MGDFAGQLHGGRRHPLGSITRTQSLSWVPRAALSVSLLVFLIGTGALLSAESLRAERSLLEVSDNLRSASAAAGQPTLNLLHRNNTELQHPYLQISLIHQQPELNFMAAAFDPTYEGWLLPYAHFALSVSTNATVELIVLDVAKYVDRHQQALDLAWKAHPGLFYIRAASQAALNLAHVAVPTMWKNVVRFLERPVLSGRITYIGDVDIVTLAPDAYIAAAHANHMHDPQWNLPYSNMIRNYSKPEAEWRFTGLHAVDTTKYFGREFDFGLAEVERRAPFKSDEHALAALCRAGYGLPRPPPELMGPTHVRSNMPPVFLYRPVHGLHISSRRGAGKRVPQEANCDECAAYLRTQVAAPHFEELMAVDDAMRAIHENALHLCSCCQDPSKKKCKVPPD